MAIQSTVTVDKTTINLGEKVTITYATSGCFDTQIQADNMPVPLDLGPGPQSGTMSFLPGTSGTFNIYVMAIGDFGQARADDSETASVAITVN
jgi:hypothetical protein